MWNGEKDTRTYFTLSDIPEYDEIFSFMVDHSKKHSLIWAEVAAASRRHPDPVSTQAARLLVSLGRF